MLRGMVLSGDLHPIAQPSSWGSFHKVVGAAGLRGGRMTIPVLLEYTGEVTVLEVSRQSRLAKELLWTWAWWVPWTRPPHRDALGAAGGLHLELRRETGRGWRARQSAGGRHTGAGAE